MSEVDDDELDCSIIKRSPIQTSSSPILRHSERGCSRSIHSSTASSMERECIDLAIAITRALPDLGPDGSLDPKAPNSTTTPSPSLGIGKLFKPFITILLTRVCTLFAFVLALLLAIDWLVGRLIGWLVGWLIGWLVGWFCISIHARSNSVLLNVSKESSKMHRLAI
jgi:hypothetical protein